METQSQTTLAVLDEIVIRFAPKRQAKIDITRETRLSQDLAIGSPRMIDIVLEVEDRLGVSLGDIDVQDATTIGDLLDLVERSRANAC
jgi:acyl carrier protein